MELEKLGYTKNWVNFGLLDKALFEEQLKDFESEKEQNNSRFRYNTFMKWFRSKKAISDRELDHFLVLTKEDEDKEMAGKAITQLFTSALISEDQFMILKYKLPELGKWTKKLITREVLKRQLLTEEITEELYTQCLDYKNEFSDNRLLVLLIDVTDNIEILSNFETNSCGKRMRTLAEKKIRKIRREAE